MYERTDESGQTRWMDLDVFLTNWTDLHSLVGRTCSSMLVHGWFKSRWKHICHALCFLFSLHCNVPGVSVSVTRLRCQHGFHRFVVCVKFEISVVLALR